MSEVGKITRVRIKEEINKLVVDVSLSPTRELEDILFRTPHTGILFVPSVGDIVEVTKVGPGRFVAHSPLQKPGFSLPTDVEEGDVVIKLNDSTFLEFREQADGTYNTTLKCDGDLQVDAANILVGEDGQRERVATESHDHDFTYDGGGDNSSTQTATTEVPNSGGLTDTEVE